MASKVAIVSAVRTPIGAFCKGLAAKSAADLGSVCIKSALERINLPADKVDEVVIGQVLTANCGQNPARQASIKAGIPEAVPAVTVGMVCGSGLKAIELGMQSILVGNSEIVVCGGQESMSCSPHVIPNSRNGHRMGEFTCADTMVTDGLWDAFNNIHMGITAENIVTKYNITREEQDQFAFESQQKAKAAIEAGKFTEEIVPVTITTRSGSITVDKDEHPKPTTTLEDLTKLRPAFKKEGGSVTAGNASGLNDGAAMVVLMTAEKAAELKLEPLALIASSASCGVDPKIMGIGPVPAVKKCLEKASWKTEEVDLFELNEAFAAQSIAVANRELAIDKSKVNVNGGAIALGHPIGCSGCRVVVTLLYEMKRRDAKKGCASLCIGGGMGVAMAFERK